MKHSVLRSTTRGRSSSGGLVVVAIAVGAALVLAVCIGLASSGGIHVSTTTIKKSEAYNRIPNTTVAGDRIPDTPPRDLAIMDVRLVRYSLNKGSGTILDPNTIDLWIENGGDFAIKRLHFEAKLETPGRSVPWIDTGFTYDPPGGIEPGESKQTTIEPGIVKAHDFRNSAFADTDAKFTLSIVKVETADGRILEY